MKSRLFHGSLAFKVALSPLIFVEFKQLKKEYNNG